MHRIKELAIVCLIHLSISVFGQDFPLILNLSPSPFINGFGGGATALPLTDAFGFAYNPAQLGTFSQRTNFSLHFYPQKTSLFSESRPDFKATAVSLGYRFGGEAAKHRISLGIGYIDGELNGGEIIYSDSAGNELDRAIRLEFYDVFAVGFGFEYFFDISLGFTYKRVSSNRGLEFSDDMRLIGIQQEYTALDYGLLFVLPMRRILPEKWLKDIKEFTIKPVADFSFGYAIRNVGDGINYNPELSEEPIPRSASMGYALRTALLTTFRNQPLNLIEINWTVQADDYLVKRNADRFSYQTIFGDLNIAKHLLLSKGDHNVINRKGLVLELADFFHYTWGSYAGTVYSRKTVSGFGFQTKAVFRLLKKQYRRSYFDFIYDHINIIYNQSTYYIDNRSKTDFHGISIIVSGL